MSGSQSGPQFGPLDPQSVYADQRAAQTPAQKSLLSHVMEFADAADADDAPESVALEPFLSLARASGAEKRNWNETAAMLVETALSLALGAAVQKDPRVLRALAAPVTAALLEDGAARSRLEQFWRRLLARVNGERNSGPA